MSDVNTCKHKNRFIGYGFMTRYLGFKGLGAYEYCEDCGEVFSFKDDLQSNTKDEIKHNKKVRAKLGWVR